MRRRTKVLLLAALVIAGCDDSVQARRRDRPPSVLLIVIDGLRADHVGCYGYPRRTTPRIDALAAQGRRFTDVVTPSPWSAPALAALLTGCYPSRLEMLDLEQPLGDDATLLPERLPAGQYVTGAVVSHPLLAAQWNLDQGFDTYEKVGESRPGEAPRDTTSALVTDAALLRIADAGKRPFVVLAHYADPLPEWLSHVDLDFGDPHYAGFVTPDTSYREILRRRDSLTTDDVVEIAAAYDSEIARTDIEVGRLLDGLAGYGRAADTIVVLTSSHGMELFDHGDIGDAKTLFDELLHVPLVLRGPGVEEGIEGGAVGLIDVVPTLLDLLGLPIADDVDGIAVRPQEPLPGRELFAETDRAHRLRAAMSGPWKLIHDLESGDFDLYDLLADPSERADVYEKELDVSAAAQRNALRAALLEWEAGASAEEE